MANDLYPAYIITTYRSAWGLHHQTIPTVPIVANALMPSGFEFDLRGAAVSVDLDDAVRDFYDVVKPILKSTFSFVDYVAYSVPAPGQPGQPIFGAELSIVGTSGSTPMWEKATQMTFNFRTEGFGAYRYTLLDCGVGSFDKDTPPYTSTFLSIINYITAESSWFSGRDGDRPTNCISITATLNEKLRRAYGMA
ncbi:MAG TPA: hypothetical protein VFQ05_19050 [Candidatus Eisenbacteria bacterium]|nr:hypothetical protein [Candidatus Eisenbacteria bacterium]